MNVEESNIDRLLKVRAEVDQELRRHRDFLTVLFTDVVGSTSYFDRFGDTYGLMMLQRHAKLASSVVNEFGGKVIKTIGDSVMAEFSQPAWGVRAAVEIQRRVGTLNRSLSPDDRLQLRIGINHGPAFRHEKDLFGDAVNLAARITKRTGPAQVLVSSTVRIALADQPEFHLAPLGEVTIAGKTGKEDIFEVIWTDTAVYDALREDLTVALQQGDLISPGLKLEELAQLTTPTATPPAPNTASVPVATTNVLATGTTLSTGTAIDDRYEILQDIGRGGMGLVYKALDRETGEIVALKILKSDLSNDPAIKERFKNELRLARKITHRNICRIHEFHRTHATAYISMEFVQGQSLRKFLQISEKLPLETGLTFVLAICAGLKEAHSAGVIHRDLKPENIMVDKNGQIKIMDFGIARSVDSAETLVATGAVVGTPYYMSPEQARGCRVDGRSDIYSLGLILYEMFTGKRPFEGETPIVVALKHIQEAPPAPRNFTPGLPSELEMTILRCLEKDPGKRFQRIEELETEINSHLKCLTDVSLPTLEPTPTMSVPDEAFATAHKTPTQKTTLSGMQLGDVVSEQFTESGAHAAKATSITAESGIPTLMAETSITGNQPTMSPTWVAAQSMPPDILRSRVVLKRPWIIGVAAMVLLVPVILALPPFRTKAVPVSIPDASPAQLAAADSVKSELPAAAAPQVQNETTELEITTNPPGAEVTIDGKIESSHTPSRFSLSRGEHSISVRSSGYKTQKRSLKVEGVELQRLNVDLIAMNNGGTARSPVAPAAVGETTEVTPPIAAAIPGSGRIEVHTTPPGAKISVDGKKTEFRSPANFELPSGTHQITLELKGFVNETREITVSNNAVLSFGMTLQRESTKRRFQLW
jgi:serine/threonine protein kinase/class 3 adenylate cyclase